MLPLAVYLFGSNCCTFNNKHRFKVLSLFLAIAFMLIHFQTSSSQGDGVNVTSRPFDNRKINPLVRVLLDWIAQSTLVDWIMIDNSKSKSDFGFGLSIQFCHFNPNPKYQNYFFRNLNFILVYQTPTMKPSYFLSKFSNNQ